MPSSRSLTKKQIQLKVCLAFMPFLVLLLKTPVAAFAEDVTSARHFVENLYRSEVTGSFNVLGKQAGQVFSSDLLRLIRQDEAANRGYVAAMDYDPICGCQDADSMKVEAIDVVQSDKTHATANVRVGYGQPKQQVITLLLVLIPNGWRVEDIVTKETPSLRQFLRKSLMASKRHN